MHFPDKLSKKFCKHHLLKELFGLEPTPSAIRAMLVKYNPADASQS
jgi:hypothetical protein